MEELIKQAEGGDAESQYQLGLAYYNGDGIKQNNSKAYYWFQKAIEQGCVEAKSWVDKNDKDSCLDRWRTLSDDYQTY